MLAKGTGLPRGDHCFIDVFVRDLARRTTERASISSTGRPANGDSQVSSISSDGRYVVFQSEAANLDPRTAELGPFSVFVHDRVTDETRLVSVSLTGKTADGISVEPAISADGRHVAFTSKASNLVHGDANDDPDLRGENRLFDIFVRTRRGSAW